MNMEEYIRDIRFGLISLIPVEDSEGVCEEVAFTRVALSTFDICDSAEDGIILCRFILDLDRNSPW